jgi:hypothetical protein
MLLNRFISGPPLSVGFRIDLIYHKLKEGPNFLKVILDKTHRDPFQPDRGSGQGFDIW